MVVRDWPRLAALCAVTSAPGLLLALVAWRRLPGGDVDWFTSALRPPSDAGQAVWFAVIALLLGRMVLVTACTWTFAARRVGRTRTLGEVVAAGMRGDMVRAVAPGPLAILAVFSLQQVLLQPDRGVWLLLFALLGIPGLLLASPVVPLLSGLWWVRTVVILEQDAGGAAPDSRDGPQLRVRDLMRGHTMMVWGWSIALGGVVWAAMAIVIAPIAGGWPVGPLGWIVTLAVANATVPLRVAMVLQMRRRVLGSPSAVLAGGQHGQGPA